MDEVEQSEDQHALLTQEEFDKLSMRVTDAMISVVRPTVTSLCSSSEKHVRLEGTGTYVSVDKMCFILTCAHVTDAKGTDFGFYGSSKVVDGSAGVLKAENIDAALIDVPEFVWHRDPHNALAVPFDVFLEKHDPVERELFYLSGFAGENTHYFSEKMEGTATCYTTQINRDAEFEDRYFYLHWRPGQVTPTEGTDEEVAKFTKAEDPHGLSGALVWDTGFVRTYGEDRDWSPDDARITGMVTRWDQASSSLVVRRIEDIREWMLTAIGHKA